MAIEQEARVPSKVVHKPYMENRSLSRDSPDSQLRMSLTGTAHAEDGAPLPTTPTMAGKRKQPELNSAGRFRVVSQMVIAMRRFQGTALAHFSQSRYGTTQRGEVAFRNMMHTWIQYS